MSDEYPPDPEHWEVDSAGNYMTPNVFWPDASGFCFDLPPRMVIHDEGGLTWFGDWYEGGIYDVPKLQRIPYNPQFVGWTNWVDKFQKDYRFGAMSDGNSRANLFPEAQDPWMFTEYVFEGKGKDSDNDDAEEVTTSAIEPAMFHPLRVERELVSDGDSGFILQSSEPILINGQLPTTVPFEHQVSFDIDDMWESEATGKRYWTSELAASSWVELTETGEVNRNFNRYPSDTNPVQRRVVRFAAPKVNSGVKIFRQTVWSKATRWGHSQNIPPRTITLTAPREFFKPEGIFTGRIIPQITIAWGIPLYDVCTLESPQKTIKYDYYAVGYGSTNTRIGMEVVELSGPDGDPAGTFTYPLSTTEVPVMDQVPLPRDYLTQVRLKEPNYEDDDLVHRGCQFWVGKKSVDGTIGEARCRYFLDYQEQFGVLWEESTEFTDDTVAFENPTTVAPFFDNEERLEAWATNGTDIPVRIEGQDASLFELQYIRDSGSAVTAVRLVLSSDTEAPVYPLKPFSEGGIFTTPGASVTIRLMRVRKNRPIPHKAHCGLYRNEDGQDPENKDEAKLGYREAGGKCQYYTPVGPRVVASYENEAANGAEWANMQHGLPPGYTMSPAETAYGQTMMGFFGAGLGVGAGVVSNLAMNGFLNTQTPDPYTDGLNIEGYQRIEVTYEPEIISLTGKTTYYNTSNGKPKGKDPESDIRVRPEGFHPIDWKSDEPYSGVDSVFFGFVNQFNYRVMRNVMHCYRSDKCNKIIADPKGAVGWKRGRFSAIDFRSHPLRMPGYPGIKGDDKHCHYGNGRCPYNNLDRRAVEYNANYKILLAEILQPFRINGIAAFEGQGIFQAFINDEGKVVSIDQATFEANGSMHGWMCVAVMRDDGHPPIIGHWQPILKDINDDDWRVFFYYDRPSWDSNHNNSRILAHIVQFNDENEACYLKPENFSEDDRELLDTVFGDHAEIPWLTLLDDAYEEPTGNILQATNGLSFGGGRHPEYRDMSKRGRQIMCYRGGYSDISFRQGATDSNQFGGPTWNRAPVRGRQKAGYWTEEEGTWILDGPMIPDPGTYVMPRPRMRNVVNVIAGAYPIDGKPGTTVNDPENPEFNKDGDWATVGHTYSNDTKAWLEVIRNMWENELPPDPQSDSGGKIAIAPPNPNEHMLPRERYWYRCDKCGLDYPEEEVNYYETLENSNGDKLFPLPESESYNINGARMGCTRSDGGVVRFQGYYDRFMNTYARGHADVWGPPGSTVKHDAFFWKQPTVVNRTHTDSIMRKLGVYNTDENGGGYTFDTLVPDVDQYGKLPISYGRGYQPGINRQIVAPLAQPGDYVADARAAVSDDFDMLDTDFSTILRPGQQMFPVQDEATFTLQSGDVLTFWRRDPLGGKPFVIGIPIGVMTLPSQSLLSDSIVQNDATNNPRPQRADFDPGPVGDRHFQSELRLWLLDVVSNTLIHYSSSIYMQANLLASQLEARGLDGESANPLSPSTGETLELDERVLAPYGLPGGGLKMVTLKNLKGLRNRILPMLGYDLTADTYKAGGDFTDRQQSHHTDRFREIKKTVSDWTPVYGTIPPQVLAATETGKDYYVEWELGDIEGNKARAYYPTGTTWWRMNQLVGQIKRDGGINELHLDKPDHHDYTGDVITSTATYFLHGRIPMHMEVVRALLIYHPSDPPSFDAIGCQGQYTGNSGSRDLYGNFIPGTYIGHDYCFWQHYHGFTTNHESDRGNFGSGPGAHGIGGYHGLASKRHAEEHDPNHLSIDDPTLPVTLTSSSSEDVVIEPQLWEVSFLSDYKPWLDGNNEDAYFKQVNIMSSSFVDKTYGWNVNQGFIKPWSWGQVIKFFTNEYGTWRDITYAQWNKLIERYQVRFKAAVNTTDHVQTGTYFGSTFRGMLYARENQPIPGWLDYNGYDSSGRFNRRLDIEDQVTGVNPQTLEDDGIVVTEPGGGNGVDQAGGVAKVLDITDAIKRLYNDRVDRFYKCQLGMPFEALFEYVKSKTDTNFGIVDRFHTNWDDPLYFWNYRYVKNLYGIWLNDPWHHAPLVNGMPASGSDVGDPIMQGQEDRDAVVESVSAWDDQGLEDTDEDYKQYHPLSLLTTTIPTFDEESTPAEKPIPQTSTDKYWRVRGKTHQSHQITFDLRQNPYEYERRNWRYDPPRTDSSGAVCPNFSCLVHQNGWTVGQLYQEATSGWGGWPIPSTASEWCAECGTKMGAADGVQYLDGDGLLTVFYDPKFEQDPIITGVEADVVHASWQPTLKHGFIIEYYNTKIGQWRELFSVVFDTTTNKFLYRQWSASGGWTEVATTNLPTIFRGVEGGSGQPKDPIAAAGAHFIAVGAAKVRIRVPEPCPVIMHEPSSGYSSLTVVDVPGRKVRVASLNDAPENYVGRKVFIKSGAEPEVEVSINEALAVPDSEEVDLILSGGVTEEVTEYRFEWKEYIVKVTKLRVFGYPYAKGEVVMTPPGHMYPMLLNEGIDRVRIDAWPSQIYDVQMLVGESFPVQSEEATDFTDANFHWETKKMTYDGHEYLRITKGRWRYDYNRNEIVIPSKYKDPDTGEYKGVWTLNEELYTAEDSTFTLKTRPTQLDIEYLTGVGVGIDVGVSAIGSGPSYQLEPDSVCFILGESEDVVQQPPEIQSYDALPAMGDSVPLKNRQGLKFPMKWHVYNHKPLVWGRSVGWLVGDELGAGGWGDSSVMDIFTGNHGYAVCDLGQYAYLGGTVGGEVTLYGTPNTILSGDIYVYAKAITTRTYNLPDGTTVQTKERTGGYRSGAFVFRLEVDGSVSNRRTGITAPVPRVMVYMRERDLKEHV